LTLEINEDSVHIATSRFTVKITLIGATGNAGSRILAELLAREHTVKAIARRVENVTAHEHVEAANADVNDQELLGTLIAGSDVVISAVKFTELDIDKLIRTIQQSGVRRFLVVGGAGSLWLSPGVREVDGPNFPPHVKPEALKGALFLDKLRASTLDWTFLSPSRIFFAGERTGQFRVGEDTLLFDAAGKSSISFEDYAMALVDEIETPRHARSRFTVGY
jgi:putative NADH-flavin reductase